MKNRLIIIDGHALIHRSFHALPTTLRTKSGQITNAVYGFSSFLIKALDELKPNQAILSLDKKGTTFRHQILKITKLIELKPQTNYINKYLWLRKWLKLLVYQ